jgi:hypothetical protein
LPAWSSTPRVPGLSWMWWCQGTFGTDLGPCIHFCLVLWGQQFPRKIYPNLYIYIIYPIIIILCKKIPELIISYFQVSATAILQQCWDSPLYR